MKQHRSPKGFAERILLAEDFSDLTVAEIAEVLEMPVSTVRGALRRIRVRTGKTVPHVAGRSVRWCDMRGDVHDQ